MAGNIVFQSVAGDIVFKVAYMSGGEGAGEGFINGGIFIRDIVPQGDGWVGEKQWYTTDRDLHHCKTDTQLVRVHFLMLPGHSHYKGICKINTITIPFTENPDRPVFEGYLDMDLNWVEALVVTHEDGPMWKTYIEYVGVPIIELAEFTGGYPGSQTELKQGDTFDLHIECDQQFTYVEVADYGAYEAQTFSVSATDNTTITGIIADRGTTTQALGAKVRVRNAQGAYSPWYLTQAHGSVDGQHLVNLNNQYPVINLGPVAYPTGQQALKNNEPAQVHNTVSYFNTLVYSSPNSQLSIENASTYETEKVVRRIAGGYNITVDNLKVVANRAANDATSEDTICVFIAHDNQIITVTEPSRLRSGGNVDTVPQNHTITITSNQNLIEAPTISAPVGLWQGSGFVGGPTAWTRQLQIHDNDTKGEYSWTALNSKNLAGRVVTAITGDSKYIVGGFVFRVLTVGPWHTRTSWIGTAVALTGKLRCTNLSKGDSGSLNFSYKGDKIDEVDKYTIVDMPDPPTPTPTGTYWYNCDVENAVSNTTFMLIELEEIV